MNFCEVKEMKIINENELKRYWSNFCTIKETAPELVSDNYVGINFPRVLERVLFIFDVKNVPILFLPKIKSLQYEYEISDIHIEEPDDPKFKEFSSYMEELEKEKNIALGGFMLPSGCTVADMKIIVHGNKLQIFNMNMEYAARLAEDIYNHGTATEMVEVLKSAFVNNLMLSAKMYLECFDTVTDSHFAQGYNLVPNRRKEFITLLKYVSKDGVLDILEDRDTICKQAESLKNTSIYGDVYITVNAPLSTYILLSTMNGILITDRTPIIMGMQLDQPRYEIDNCEDHRERILEIEEYFGKNAEESLLKETDGSINNILRYLNIPMNVMMIFTIKLSGIYGSAESEFIDSLDSTLNALDPVSIDYKVLTMIKKGFLENLGIIKDIIL